MRVKAIEPEAFDTSLQSVLADILRLRGGIHHLHRVLANSPKALSAFMTFSEYVRDTSDLEPRLRELVVLRVATLHQVEYEMAHHQAPAMHAGLSAEQIACIAQWREHTALFSPREQAVLAYAEESAATFRVTDTTFAAVRQYLSDREIVDVSLVVGWYLLCAAILIPLEVDVETKS